MKGGVWLDLIVIFAPLSFLTIGGGQSIVADIHRQSVVVHGWMTDAQFLELFALSRLAPGPGSLLVTLIGWKADGWVGAIVASIAIFVPSSVLVLGLANVWGRYKDAAWPRVVEAGLAPVATGMILAAACTVFAASGGGVLAWIIVAVSTAAFLFTKVNPLVMLALGAAVTVLVGR